MSTIRAAWVLGLAAVTACSGGGHPGAADDGGPVDTAPGDAGVDAAPSCSDGVMNGGETGIDCGGSCPEACPPPDPATFAPRLDPGVATQLADAVAFLYSGPDAIQLGVAPGTFERRRVSVLRGRVLDGNGMPQRNVTVDVLDHAEYGHTTSRQDGQYDLVVNGGGPLTLRFTRAGLIPGQRTVVVPWQAYLPVPEIALVAYDGKVTTIDFSAPIQVARQNPVSDSDGTRTTTLMFSGGTTASMTLADGTRMPLSQLSVRATEFTVGDHGPAAMPGALPPSSAYTYAVELSVDEAVAMGATSVQFSQPVAVYLENFLGMPTGASVPAGYYDRARGAWVASKNGRVIQVLSTAGSSAAIDSDGDGIADDAATLAALGVTGDELRQLATLYTAGTSLWRVMVTHFTPWDFNYPYGPPLDARAPKDIVPLTNDLEAPCEKKGCVLNVENRTLGESIPIAGTHLKLNYASAQRREHEFPIQLTGPSVPQSLKSVELWISVAGATTHQTFPPSPNQRTTFQWDGKDGFGREIWGKQTVTIAVGYTYDIVYFRSPREMLEAFALPGVADAEFQRGRKDFTMWTYATKQTGSLDPRNTGLGGWLLGPQHTYDPQGKLYLGSGKVLDAYPIGVVPSEPGPDRPQPGATPVMATLLTTSFLTDYGIAAGPDGTIYFTSYWGYVAKLATDGTMSILCGDGTQGSNTGDGGPAIQAKIDRPYTLVVGTDGSIYVASHGGMRVRKIDPHGIITTVVGGGPSGTPADGALATAVSFQPGGLAIAPDGTLFVTDKLYNRIYRIGLDGVLHYYAGDGIAATGADEIPATQSSINYPTAIALAPDGTLYLAEGSGQRVRSVTPDGTIHAFAGTGIAGFYGDGGPAIAAQLNTPVSLAVRSDGAVLLSDVYNGRIRRVTPDGMIATIIGTVGPIRDGVPGTKSGISNVQGLAIGPDGDIYFASNATIRTLTSHPKRNQVFLAGQPYDAIPSPDGRELYAVGPNGYHAFTLDGLTGLPRYTFTHAGSRVTSIGDAYGNTMSIMYDANNVPKQIVAPNGAVTSLEVDANGWLSKVTEPDGGVWQMTTESGGELTKLVDPNGGAHVFTYDTNHRLLTDTDATNAEIAFAETDPTSLERTIAVTSGAGRQSTYDFIDKQDNTRLHTLTDPAGAITQTRESEAAAQVSLGDGTLIASSFDADARYGLSAPLVTSHSVTTPNGLVSTITTQRASALSSPADPFSYSSEVDTTTINGRVYTTTYTKSTSTLSYTTPTGRQSKVLYNADGRVISETLDAGLAADQYAYDGAGRLVSRVEGGQSWTYAYDPQGHVHTATDGAGGFYTLGYDAVDRRSQLVLPSGAAYAYGWDKLGALTSVMLPSGISDARSYSAAGDVTGYTPAGGTATAFTYNADRDLVSAAYPSGRVASRSYDAAGRLAQLAFPEATVTATWAGATGQLASLTRTPTGGAAQTLTRTWDGPLLVGDVASGVAGGAFAFRYDPSFLLIGVTLDANPETAIAHDADGQITAFGPFTWTRGGPAGAISRISDTALVLALGYDSHARRLSRTWTVGPSSYRASATMDGAGHVAAVDETVAATTTTFVYSYDPDGRLVQVASGGSPIEAYSYDADGNVTSVQRGGAGALSAMYDVQHRLVQLGATTYAYNADGQLAMRGGDAFQYSARGELLSATVGGSTVTYDYDGLVRRVARSEAGATMQYLYGNPKEPSEVTATRSPNGLTYYYYDDAGYVYALRRGAVTYYVATDLRGSPRVVTASDGTIVKTISYDAFGNATDSNPAFELAIGFAGGLADSTTGLVHVGFRDYEPASGRFVSRDPLLDESNQPNLYLYCDDDPVGFRDPSGMVKFSIAGYAGLGGGLSFAFWGGDFSICVEGGIGVGGGVDIAPFAKPDETGTSIVQEVKVGYGLGALTYEHEAKWNKDCKTFEHKQGGKLSLGPLSLDTHGELSVSAEDEHHGLGFEMKEAGKRCAHGKF